MRSNTTADAIGDVEKSLNSFQNFLADQMHGLFYLPRRIIHLNFSFVNLSPLIANLLSWLKYIIKLIIELW